MSMNYLRVFWSAMAGAFAVGKTCASHSVHIRLRRTALLGHNLPSKGQRSYRLGNCRFGVARRFDLCFGKASHLSNRGVRGYAVLATVLLADLESNLLAEPDIQGTTSKCTAE